MEFSFIHISDIHLGRPFKDLSLFSYDIEALSVYKKAVETAFYNALDFAISNKVDFVLISGDTFDSEESDFASKLTLKQGLKKLESENIHVYMICGNHDPVSAFNKNTFNFDSDSIIKIAGVNCDYNSKFIYINKDNIPCAVIHALSYTQNSFCENPVKYFTPPSQKEAELFNIGLLHCDLNGDKESPYAPCTTGDLKALNYNYWALGHIHIPQKAEENIQYSGTIQARNTKETSAHGIRYIKVKDGCINENSFIPMDVVRFENINVDLSSANDITDAYSLIIKNINTEDSRYYLLKINLTGRIKFYNQINDEFYNVVSEKIKQEISDKIQISRFTNSASVYLEEDILKNDEGIAGEIYKTSCNNELYDKIFNNTAEETVNIIKACDFKKNAEYDEFEEFKQSVTESVKKGMLSLCADIYENGIKEE